MPLDLMNSTTCKGDLEKLNETLQLLSSVSLSLRTSVNTKIVRRHRNENHNNRIRFSPQDKVEFSTLEDFISGKLKLGKNELVPEAKVR